MALSYTYDGGALTHKVPPSLISIPQRAENGEPSFGGIPIEDPTGTLTMLGHRPFIVAESACSQPRLFTGYVAQRDMGRSYEQTQWIGADPRLFDTTIVDQNAIFGFRLISETDGNRPDETWDARLAWILGSDYMAGLFGGDTTFIDAHPNPMDAADYRGSTPGAVFDDLVNRFPGAMNYFAFWNPDTSDVEIAVFGVDDVIGLSALAISNVETDIDLETTFAPDMVAKLAREPDQVYSEVLVRYANGTVFRTLDSTATTHIRRGTTLDMPYTGKASTAETQGDRFLVTHATERDRITCVMQSIPAASVGLVRAGQSIQVRFSHMPGYEISTAMRIVMCAPVPVSDLGDLWDISLELVGPVVTAPTGLDAWITSHHSRFYNCSSTAGYDYYGDGAELVGWESDGDSPPTGYTAMPAVGPIEYLDWPFSKETCIWSGFTVTADATADIELVGNFGGVAGATPATITIQIRQNGDIIGSHTETDPSPRGAHGWTGTISLVLNDVDISSGDEFTATVVFANWVDYNYFAVLPSMLYPHSHFRITGTGAWAGTDPGPELPEPGGTTVSTIDPTVDDDADAGYHVGDMWINTTTGEVFILVDETNGAAVWASSTAATEELLEDYVPRIEVRRGPDRVSGLLPVEYDSAAAWGWTNIANATDGNLATYATMGDAVIGAGTYYVGFRFDLTTQKSLSLLYFRTDGPAAVREANDWGGTVRIRYSDDNSAWTTLDTVTPDWTLVSTGVWEATFAHLQTSARYWEVSLVRVRTGLGTDYGCNVYEVTWRENLSSQHTIQSDLHRDVATTTPTNGQLLTWDDATDTWGPEDAPGTSSTGYVYFIVDGGGADIDPSPAPEVDLVMPVDGEFTEWTLLADSVGNAEVDLWLDTYGNFPPTVDDSIVDSNYPAISSQSKATDTDLSDWTTVAFSAGNILRLHLLSASDIGRLSLAVKYTRT